MPASPFRAIRASPSWRIGLSGPLLGLIATTHGYASLFLCAAAASLSGLASCVRLRARPPGGLASPSAVG